MTDRPEESGSGGWHDPEQENNEQRYPWYKPEDGLTDTGIDRLKHDQQAAETETPESVIGSDPIATGAWYAPPQELPEEVPETPEEMVLDFPSEPVIPDAAIRSAASPQGGLDLPPNLGVFNPAQSEEITGFQAEKPAEPVSQFDPARSGKLPGLGADEPKLQPASQFDPARSGKLPGLGADEPKPQPASQFDPARSGKLPGLGASEPVQEVASAETPRDSTQVSSDTNAAPAEPVAAAATSVDQFAVVEDKVNVLRRQFTEGRLTREQLQDELRRLMIFDDTGRWWMLGLETNRWYRFDGHQWAPDEPPRPVLPAAAAPAQAAPRKAEEPIIEAQFVQQPIAAQETPLPSKVPLADADPTLVGSSSLNFGQQSAAEPTVQSAAKTPGSERTVPHQPTPAQPQFDQGVGGGGGYGVSGAQPAAVEKPYKQKMQGIQPDYSEAFSGYLNRASVFKWGLRLTIFGIFGALALTFFIIIGMLLYYFYVVNQYSDAINNLGEYTSDFETVIIYDAEGNTLAEFNDPRTGARRRVTLDEISPYLIHATISTEDETFYENPGFSLPGILRAMYTNLRTGGQGGGASTITQQLARALVFDAEFAGQRTSNRKIQEIIVAAEISRKYSKNEILEFYLNEIYYGNLAYGVEAASEVYFNKPARDLNIAEAAFLAGLPQSPALYDPVVNRDGAVERMKDVLRLMQEANGDGCLFMQHGDYNGAPFCVTDDMVNNQFVVEIAQVQSQATFSPPRFEARYPHFVNYVYQELEAMYGQSIYGSGFEVHTTIVPRIQDAAQQAVLDELPITPNANNAAIVAIRPRDGAVLAMVGSADFNSDGRSEVNGADIKGLVNVLFSPQQPGSSIKPLIYLAAFEGAPNNGGNWFPGTIVWDVPSCWPSGAQPYCPRNYSGTFLGPITVRQALGNSLNIPAIKAMTFASPAEVEELLARFQIQFPGETPTVAGLPAAIGGIEIYPFELTAAYAALANNGVYQSPYAISYIKNSNGDEIYRASTEPAGTQVVSPQLAYLITHVLKDAEARYAGAVYLSIPGWESAAKTGTTNDVRDVWTIGYTTQVAVGVWVGNTDNTPMGAGVTSGNTASPIWNKVMTTALQGLSPSQFPVPGGLSQYQICDYTGAQYAQGSCPFGSAITEIAMDSAPPPQPGQAFVITLDVDAFSGLLKNEHCDEYVESRTYLAIQDATAIEWLRGAGASWAQSHGIDVANAAQPPTQECQPGMPRPTVVLSFPQPNQEIAGLVEFRGQVTLPADFRNYEFQLAPITDPNNFQVIGQQYFSQHPSPNEFLGSFDFAGTPNGQYVLRLAAHNNAGATAYSDVPIVINNVAAPTAVPTSFPTPTLAPSPTPFQDVIQPTSPVFEQPTPTTDPFQPIPPTTEGQ